MGYTLQHLGGCAPQTPYCFAFTLLEPPFNFSAYAPVPLHPLRHSYLNELYSICFSARLTHAVYAQWYSCMHSNLVG